MTTSIAFDITDCGEEISFNSSITFNPDTNYSTEYSPWLLDPNAPRDALQRLRVLKIRNTKDEVVIPNIIGRLTGNSIDFETFSYDQLKMRRKAEILRMKNKEFDTKQKNYSKIVRGVTAKFSSQNKIRRLAESQKCSNVIILEKPAINSGIRNDNTNLYLNTSIPFYSQL